MNTMKVETEAHRKFSRLAKDPIFSPDPNSTLENRFFEEWKRMRNPDAKGEEIDCIQFTKSGNNDPELQEEMVSCWKDIRMKRKNQIQGKEVLLYNAEVCIDTKQ